MQDLYETSSTSHSNNFRNFEQRDPGRIWTGTAAPLYIVGNSSHGLFRKEVIQPQVLLRLPCYDFTPIMSHTLGLFQLGLLVQPTFVM